MPERNEGVMAMKVKMLAKWGAGVLTVAALLGAATLPAGATVLYRDSFEKGRQQRQVVGGVQEATPGGSGWRATGPVLPSQQPFQGIVIDLGKAGVHREGGLASGTISLWIQRGEITQNEGVINFTDANYGLLARLELGWPGWGLKSPELGLKVEPGRDYPLWYVPTRASKYDSTMLHGTSFALPGINRGQWFNLALTWGPQASDNAILVNGVKIQARPEADFALGRLVADAAYLVLGANLDTDRPKMDEGALPPVGTPMHSLIDAIEIHDTVATAFAAVYADPDAARVRSVEHDASRKAGFSGKLVAGNVVDVTVHGTPGAVGTFDVVHYPDIDRKIDLDWRGWGVYLEDKTFFEEGEVNLRDVDAYRVYWGTSPIDTAAPGNAPFERLDFKVQKYTIENLDIDTPYYVAVLAVMRDGSLRKVYASPTNVPAVETQAGVYVGSWAATYQDKLPRAVVVGRVVSGKAVGTLAGDAKSAFAVDPGLTIAVASDPSVLKADEKSTSKISVTVTDANGNPVPGHELKFLLATTSQYTGVVGGGAFTEQVGGSLKETLSGETDLFGRMSVTYIAGFAAKTAVIVARDMASNSTGAGFVKTFIQSTAQLELEPTILPALASGYKIRVTSSDEWLTADGKSTARITAKVTKDGEPVEGHPVKFAVASGTGSIRVVTETTDRRGEARAVYTAGKKIGIVLITATDTEIGLTGSVQIELRSDAPAKIVLKLQPEKLPADGRSTAELSVLVTDINDNPNDNTLVEYALTEGTGELREESTVTDRRGETSNRYTAGTTPGRVTIELTVRSPEPTAEELVAARNLAVTVLDHDFF